jgi:hypothetical protein
MAARSRAGTSMDAGVHECSELRQLAFDLGCGAGFEPVPVTADGELPLPLDQVKIMFEAGPWRGRRKCSAYPVAVRTSSHQSALEHFASQLAGSAIGAGERFHNRENISYLE